MSARSVPKADAEGSDLSSSTLRELTAASNEVHMLATLTAAMMDAQNTDRKDDTRRRSGPGADSTSTSGTVVVSEPSGERSQRRRSSSRSRLRPASNATITAAAGALLDRMRSSGQQANARSGIQITSSRLPQRLPVTESPGSATSTGMSALRRHVEDLSAQLKLARAKQETDAKVIQDLRDENVRLKHLLDSANEVSDAAATSLRELARSRRTCEDFRQQIDSQQRRAQDAETRCEQLQQLLRDAEARAIEMEQRASSARAQLAERTCARSEQEVTAEKLQHAERRAVRAEQIAAQEQARAADAGQRAHRAEAAAAEDHERALDAERRAARAEHLLEQLQEQALELERQVACAEQQVAVEVDKLAEAERRASRAEQAAAAEKERAAGAERRVTRAEEEVEQARTLAAEKERRASVIEEAAGEERARADAADRRAARAEQAAEEARQLLHEAERRLVRASQLQDEAERRAARLDQLQEEAVGKVEEAERRAARAVQANETAEKRALEAERRAARAEQAQQDSATRAAESDRRAARAEQSRDEAVAEAERRASRAEQAAEEARAHAVEMERRASRAEAAAQQDRHAAAETERQTARVEQALEQAQTNYVAMEKRAMRAEQAAEEARSRTEEARVLVGQAEARAARAEQAATHERERAQEEARHAARMEAAAIQDQERAREADERAAAAVSRAQQAETRMAVAEGHTAALELRLQQALAYADAADARAVEAERRYDRLASESRDLHAAVVLASQPEPPSPRALPSRTAQQMDRDRSPRRLQWNIPTNAADLHVVRRDFHDDIIEQRLNSPRRWRLSEGGTGDRVESQMNGAGDTAGISSPSSTPVASVVGVFNSRIRLWADAYSTPPEQGPGESARKLLEDGHGVRALGPARGNGGAGAGGLSNLDDALGPASHPCSPRRPGTVSENTWGSSKTAQQYMEVYLDGNPVLADELRHVRAELRSTRHELGDVKSRYQAACNRVQQLEEDVASAEQMKAKLEKLAVQARKSEQLAAELRICRAQLEEVEGLQMELRKAQAESASAQGLRMALEEARAQLVDMDRVRSEARRLNASLQTVTRERDSARNELAEASAQLVGMATLRTQLQRAEAAVLDAEQSREEARAVAIAATMQIEKLRTQLAVTEEELAETVRRCARVQAVAEEAAHQRDRLQVALAGAEGALQAAEEERIVLAAEQERLKGKAQELVEAQEELRMLRSQLQEAATTQRRAVQAEEQAHARAEEAQQQVSALKAQLAEAQSDVGALQHQLQTTLGQLHEMKDNLDDAALRLEGCARVEAQLAATVDRAEKAESQLRNCKEDLSRSQGEAERLQQELAQVRRELAKSQEEMANAAALANSRGARATELEHEVAVLREKSYQLDVEVASMTTEVHRLKTDLASASNMIDEATSARNQLLEQLSEASKHQARISASASAAEDRMKADMQQLQVRLAATEAELRTLQHNNGSLHDELERARTDILSLQGMLQDEMRLKDECGGECRRLQRDLELVNESLAQAQRAQRGAVAGASELEAEIDRLRTARGAVDAELQANAARVQRLQEDVRQLSDRNNELAGQVHGLSSTIRQLEAENARLADGHATLTIQLEARAAEVRAARGEAAELAADRARLLADLHDVRTEVENAEAERAQLLTRFHGASYEVVRSRGTDTRITITGGGIPPISNLPASNSPISDASGSKRVSHAEPATRLAMPKMVLEEPLSIVPSPNGDLQALLGAPLDTGALLAGTADLSHYEALLAALDEEAQHLDEELAGKEASSSVLLQRMRATKQAITARMDALQTALHSARDAESEMRRRAVDKELTIHRLQQQLAQLSGAAGASGVAGVAHGAGPSVSTPPVGFGANAQQGNAVITTLRQDLDAAHERLRDAGRQLREAQQRAQTAEAEASQLRDALAKAHSDVARLQNELTDNDRVLSDAECALISLVSEKEAIENLLEAAKSAERAAVEAAEGLRSQVSTLQSQLDAALEAATTAPPLGTEPSGGMTGAVYDRMINYLQSLDAGDPPAHSSDGGPDHTLTAASSAPAGQVGTAAAHHQRGITPTRAAAGVDMRPANRRYPLGSRTSESDSTLSAFRNGVNQADWDAVSASAWDNSAAGSMGGRAATVPGVVLFSSTGTEVTTETSSSDAPALKHHLSDMSVAPTDMGSISASVGNGKAVELIETAPGGLGGPPSGFQSPSLSTQARKMWSIGLRSFDAEDDRARTCARTISVPSITPPGLRNSASGNSVAGLVMKARASAAAASSMTAATASSMGLGGTASPTGLVSPVSPLSSSGYQIAADHSVSRMHQSLDCMVDELGGRPRVQGTSSTKPSSSLLSVITTSSEDAPIDTLSALERNENTSKADCEPEGEVAPTTEMATSNLLMRTSPTSLAATPRLLTHQSYQATIFTSIRGAESPGVSSLGKSKSAGTPVRAVELGGSVFSARQAAVADAGAALQSASHRLSPRSAAARSSGVDNLNVSPDGADQGMSGGSGSPVMSPRHMLRGRSLSRALHQVTSPRTPGAAASPGKPITDQGSTGEKYTEHQTAKKNGPAPPVRKSMVQSASDQPNVSPNQADITKSAAVTPLSQQRQMSAFQSPSASSIAAAAAGAREAVLNTEDPAYALVADKRSLSFGHQTRRTSMKGTAVVAGPDHDVLGPGKLPAGSAHLPSVHLSSVSRNLGSQTAGDDDSVSHQRGSAWRALWTKSADSPKPQRPSIDIASASKRLTTSQPVTPFEDGESFLAKRLAAMDEALRAIGAV